MDPDQQGPPAPPEAPDKEDMDQIRLRRLAKLSGPTTPKPAQTAETSNTPSSKSSPAPKSPEPVEETTPKPKLNITKVSSPAAASTPENPFTKLNVRPSNGTPAPISTPRAPARKLATPSNDEDIDEYANRILGQIFRITVDPEQKVDASNHRLIYLPNLKAELEEENAPVQLSKETLDEALMEAASTIPHNKSILDYLLPSWKRITKALKGLRGYVTGKDAILKEAKRLCMSHCIFAIVMPEFYGREPNPSTDSLTPYLLNEAGGDKGICPDFLNEAVSRFAEDDSVKPMLTKAVAGLSLQLSNMTMNDNYKPYISALQQICQFQPLVTAIAEDPLFHMAMSAPGIEKHTLLGPFFRISPLQPEVAKEYFGSPKTMDPSRIKASQEALQFSLQTHQKDLLDITNQFIKAGPTSRNRTLDWFAHVVNANHKRRALRPDPKSLSSDAFLMNVTVVLDGLCQPFMDTTFSKVSRIEVDYFRRNPRVDIKEETKLNADQNASDVYYETKADGTSNFITEIFFLTLAAHHYGSEATNGMLKNLEKEIKYLAGKLAEMEAERPKIQASMNQANITMLETNIKRFTDVLEKHMQTKLAIEGVLFDKNLQARSILFMRYVTVFLLRTATQSDYTPDKTIQLPLKVEQPDAFKFLPEYVLEDIVSNFNFVMRFVPDVLFSALGDETIALCITFLTSSEYVKNPYLKAKLVSLLFHGTWPAYHRAKGVLGDQLTGSQFANDHLLHALLKFYIEVESTGAHTQFYDKFNIRYEIFQVIKCIWTNDVYKQRLAQESKTNTEFFLRFVNLLLNDATYVLDEALTKFPKIHDLEKELRESQLTPEQRESKAEELQTAVSQAQSYMQLTNETISMMKLFTKALSASFTMAELVDRVAAFVDYTLDILVGPKSSNLKVDRMEEKYKFSPKTLLSEFVDIYLNLGVSDSFIKAVARDGRSYKPGNFDSASRILARYSLRSPQDMENWEKLKSRFAKAKELDDQEEEDLGDVPEDFEDPLLAHVMKDPVILPVSRTVMDRSTIQSHLLSDPIDPYSRSPLRIEDVIPHPELKARIEKWREEMREKAKQARMDTTEG